MKKIMIAFALLGVLASASALIACGPSTGGTDAGADEDAGGGDADAGT